MQEFTIKVSDRKPELVATLLDGDGAPVNLTLATTVQLRLRLQGAVSPLFTSNCTITSAADGIVTYSWGVSDTSAAGTYDAEFKVTWNDGRIQTVPNAGNFRVKISSTLA